MNRQKQGAALLLALLLILSLAACGKALTCTTIVPYDAHYSEKEIRAAMHAVARHFEQEFDGCTLLSLAYDESKVSAAEPDWAAQYDADEAIVLLSSFHVDAGGGDGSLSQDATYTNWEWVLVRNGGGKWHLKTWGY